MEKLIEILKSNGYKITLPRRHLFSLFHESDVPMGIKEITYELRTVDRATVYRNIELFSETGIIKEVVFNGDKKYELSDQYQGHHHHIVCEKCGLITKIESKELEKTIAKLTKKTGYKHLNHQFEIIGLCSSHKN